MMEARPIVGYGSSFVVILLLILTACFWYLRGRAQNLPPGPTGWPILGYIPRLVMAILSGEEPHEHFSRLTRRYGDVFSVNLAGNLVVVLHGLATTKEALNQQQLTARPRFCVSEIYRPGIGVFESSGETWAEIRKFSLKVLRGLGVGKSNFEKNIASEAVFLIDEWKKHGGAPFDPRPLLSAAVSNIICSVVFGSRFQYTDETFKDLIHSTDTVFEAIGAGGVLEFSPFMSKLTFLPFVQKYISAVKKLIQRLNHIFTKHNEGYDGENLRDLLDCFLKEKETMEGAGANCGVFTFNNMEQVAGDLVVAGTETTTTTLRWSLLCMTANPEVQTRVQKELDDVTGRNRFPRISDRPDLPYTEAVLCEIQRRCTIVPLSVPHASSEDTQIRGYSIPKDTMIIANLWHNHFDPSTWKDPDEFRPQRFLDEDGNFISREELTPFGIGRRICLGEHLAKMELFIFFTLLLYNFTFKNPEDAPPVSLKGVTQATWAPRDFKICAIPRS